MKTKNVKKPEATKALEAPVEVAPDYFIPPGYSSHVTAHRRLDYIKFSDHSYTRKEEVAALIAWLTVQAETLAD